jgi:hypothetical protein
MAFASVCAASQKNKKKPGTERVLPRAPQGTVRNRQTGCHENQSPRAVKCRKPFCNPERASSAGYPGLHLP